MIVKVTQEHIDKGRNNKNNSTCCPVALALKDIFKVQEVHAYYETLVVGQFPDNLIFSKPTPIEVYNWIINFDNNEAVQPFEFELSLEGVKL